MSETALVHSRFLKRAQRFSVENTDARMGVHIGLVLEYQYRQPRTHSQQKRRQLTKRTQFNHGNVECL
nr:hypothetical protein [Nocardia abscessus]